MDTLTTASPSLHTTLHVTTADGTSFVDLTDHLQRLVSGSLAPLGILTVQTTHTTTAIVVNEHEPLLLADFEAALERFAPRLGLYEHDDMTRRTNVPPDEPANGHAHCRALVLPTSASLAIVGGRLVLGRWQRVLLVDLDGPRRREVSVVLIGARP